MVGRFHQDPGREGNPGPLGINRRWQLKQSYSITILNGGVILIGPDGRQRNRNIRSRLNVGRNITTIHGGIKT